MTHGKTYNKSPRRINHKATRSKTNTGTTALERSVEQTTLGFKALRGVWSLRPVAVPHVQKRKLISQYDDVKPHEARVCRNSLTYYDSYPLYWPPYSPALSLIENLWDKLNRREKRRGDIPVNRPKLENTLLEKLNIPVKRSSALMKSMRKRIRAATVARGHTPDTGYFS